MTDEKKPPQEVVVVMGNTAPQNPFNAMHHASVVRCALEDLIEARQNFGDESPQYKKRLMHYMPMIERNAEPILSAAVNELDRRVRVLRNQTTQTAR